MVPNGNKKLSFISSSAFVIFLTLKFVNTIDNSTKPFPIDLKDIGFNGSWNQFCDRKDIWKEFRAFPEHDLPRMRTAICTLRKSGWELTGIELQAIAAYKYCNAMQQNFRDLLMKFTDKLSLGDLKKRHFLLNPRNEANNGTACYNETLNVFYRICVGEFNPCLYMFKLILARACLAPWLTSENITSYVRESCDGEWITDDIDWEAISKSIKYLQ